MMMKCGAREQATPSSAVRTLTVSQKCSPTKRISTAHLYWQDCAPGQAHAFLGFPFPVVWSSNGVQLYAGGR